MKPVSTNKTEREGRPSGRAPNGRDDNRKARRAREGAQKEEVYRYGELDNAIGGKLTEWGITKYDGCRWLKFEMPDGRIVTVFIDWPEVV